MKHKKLDLTLLEVEKAMKEKTGYFKEHENAFNKSISSLKHFHNVRESFRVKFKEWDKRLKNERRDAIGIMQLVGKNTYIDDSFKVAVRTYREVKITDKGAFFKWLKSNLSADSIVNFLCPPTTQADLKKFVENLYEENAQDPLFQIDGISAVEKYYDLKTSYLNEE